MYALFTNTNPTAEDLDGFFGDVHVRDRLSAALCDGARVRFTLTLSGGDTVVRCLRKSPAEVHVLDACDGADDVELVCSGADFCALLNGSLKPTDGFLARRLRVTGDVGIVLRLRRAMLDGLG